MNTIVYRCASLVGCCRLSSRSFICPIKHTFEVPFSSNSRILCRQISSRMSLALQETLSCGCKSTAVVLSRRIASSKLTSSPSFERHKSNRSKPSSNTETDDEDNENDDDDQYEDDRGGSDGLPTNYRLMKVHSLRAVTVVGKGLGLSNSETEELFYKSQLLYQGSVLTKKAKQLSIGDHIDVIVNRDSTERSVQRVKVVHIARKQTRTGKPIVTVKAWRKPFVVNK